MNFSNHPRIVPFFPLHPGKKKTDFTKKITNQTFTSYLHPEFLVSSRSLLTLGFVKSPWNPPSTVKRFPKTSNVGRLGARPVHLRCKGLNHLKPPLIQKNVYHFILCVRLFSARIGVLKKNVLEINLVHIPRLFLNTFWRHATSAGVDPPLSFLVNPLCWIALDFSLYGTRGSHCVLLQQPRLCSSSECLEPCVS